MENAQNQVEIEPPVQGVRAPSGDQQPFTGPSPYASEHQESSAIPMQIRAIERQEFTDWMRNKRLMPRTIKIYLYYYDRFLFPFSQKSVELALMNAEPGNYTNVIARAFLKNYREFLTKHGFPFAQNVEIPRPVGKDKEVSIEAKDVMTEAEVKAIEGAMTSERNKVMVLLSFYSGLRVMELMGLSAWSFKWDDWLKDQTRAGRVKVLGKNNKTRISLVPPTVMERVRAWIQTFYYPRYKDMNVPMFPKTRINESRWRKVLSKASNKALGRHINPHRFRHSCATWLITEKKMPIEYVREWLGHADISTTQIYTHIKTDQLEKVFLDAS